MLVRLSEEVTWWDHMLVTCSRIITQHKRCMWAWWWDGNHDQGIHKEIYILWGTDWSWHVFILSMEIYASMVDACVFIYCAACACVCMWMHAVVMKINLILHARFHIAQVHGLYSRTSIVFTLLLKIQKTDRKIRKEVEPWNLCMISHIMNQIDQVLTLKANDIGKGLAKPPKSIWQIWSMINKDIITCKHSWKWNSERTKYY